MVVDYEAAWVRMQSLVASKTQHGREGLLSDMARIAEDCSVPAGELSKLLRLYGVEVERVRVVHESIRDEDPDSLGDSLADRTAPTPASMTKQEVTDVHRSRTPVSV